MATSTISRGYPIFSYLGTANAQPVTLTVPSGSRNVLFCTGPQTRGNAVITVTANSSGTVYYSVIGGTSTNSVTKGTNSLTYTDTGGTGAYVTILCMTLNGSPITL